MKQQTFVRKLKTRAFIRRKNKFLCIRKAIGSVVYYTLPGGTLEDSEELESALTRECAEEIGTKVKLQGLQGVFEHKTTYVYEPELLKQKLEFVFRATVKDSYVPKSGPNPDPEQTDVFWMPIKDAHKFDFIPPQLPQAIQDDETGFWSYREDDSASAFG